MNLSSVIRLFSRNRSEPQPLLTRKEERQARKYHGFNTDFEIAEVSQGKTKKNEGIKLVTIRRTEGSWDFIAFQNGKIIGARSLHIVTGGAQFGGHHTSKTSRGIGSALIAEGLKKAEEAGIAKVTIPGPFYDPNWRKHLLEKMGATPISENHDELAWHFAEDSGKWREFLLREN